MAGIFFYPTLAPIIQENMSNPTNQESEEERKRHIEEELDEALEETFPASDPIEPPSPGIHQVPE